MNRLIWLLMPLLLYGCNDSPPSIAYGRDACQACKMTIMDERFGAAIVSIKGKIMKFDDVVCMVEFIASQELQENQIRKKLVGDYRLKNHFLDAEQAVYLVSENIRSPMNGNTAAFADKQEALNLQHEKQGVIMDWKQVYNKLK